MINTTHSAVPAGLIERVRLVPPNSAVQGTGLSFAGYGAPTVTTTVMTLGADRKAGTRAPARGRPL